MSPVTRYLYKCAVVRFARFQRDHAGLALVDQVRRWLETLTPHVAHTGYLALRHTYGPQLPWSTIPKPRRPRRNEARVRGSLLSADARDRLRDSLASPRDWAMLELLWTLRRAEVARARWGDVDLSAGVIAVIRKGGKPSRAVLVAGAPVALAEWFAAAGEPPDAAPIFPGRDGGPMLPASVGEHMRDLLRRAGLYIPGRNCHAFRRTFATEYLRANPSDLRGLQDLLDHEDISTTTRYAFLTLDDLRPRLDRVRL